MIKDTRIEQLPWDADVIVLGPDEDGQMRDQAIGLLEQIALGSTVVDPSIVYSEHGEEELES